MKLEGLKLSSHQQVIFPDHIQVPEELRIGLTFGSLDGALVPSKNMNKDSTRVAPIVLIGQDAAGEPPLCDQPAGPAVEGDVSAVNGFGVVHLLQVEAAEVPSSVPSTSSSSQPAQPVGTGQNSVDVARGVKDKRTGKAKRYRFVRFANPSDLTGALKEMNGLKWVILVTGIIIKFSDVFDLEHFKTAVEIDVRIVSLHFRLLKLNNCIKSSSFAALHPMNTGNSPDFHLPPCSSLSNLMKVHSEKDLEAQSELLEQQEIKEEAEEVFKNQIFSSKLFQQRSLSIYTVAFMLEASIQVARRSNSGGNTILTGKGATVSRMSLKPSDTVSEASQMRKNLTMKQKQDASRKIYSNATSRSHKLTSHDPPSVLQVDTTWDSEGQEADDFSNRTFNDVGGTDENACAMHKQQLRPQRLETFDSTGLRRLFSGKMLFVTGAKL
ncbi:OLC1v1005387C1 [Oldenlandia corymbosa var. corymbosa]|uniref:OLC1v1005387C1 n=1 Tax=Oldenlandia corymbosa var. corymbosa TaxID=529605 RepID=A0AAV1DGH1_OLDCO|nr:OLC1v1005387C1 [Oldenlandia corymbosa var. corymbosa]